jgi:hypothetical protein
MRVGPGRPGGSLDRGTRSTGILELPVGTRLTYSSSSVAQHDTEESYD